MNVVGLIATYFVLWWLVLFAILPIGVRTQEEEGDVILGTERSAPHKPMLVRKAIATTIVTTIVVGLLWLAINVYGFDLEWLAGGGRPGGLFQ